MPDSNITDAHRRIFAALTSGTYGNFGLVSTEFDGVPTAAIVAVTVTGDTIGIAPLAVFVQGSGPDHTLFDRLTEVTNEQAAAEIGDIVVAQESPSNGRNGGRS